MIRNLLLVGILCGLLAIAAFQSTPQIVQSEPSLPDYHAIEIDLATGMFAANIACSQDDSISCSVAEIPLRFVAFGLFVSLPMWSLGIFKTLNKSNLREHNHGDTCVALMLGCFTCLFWAISSFVNSFGFVDFTCVMSRSFLTLCKTVSLVLLGLLLIKIDCWLCVTNDKCDLRLLNHLTVLLAILTAYSVFTIDDKGFTKSNQDMESMLGPELRFYLLVFVSSILFSICKLLFAASANLLLIYVRSIVYFLAISIASYLLRVCDIWTYASFRIPPVFDTLAGSYFCYGIQLGRHITPYLISINLQFGLRSFIIFSICLFGTILFLLQLLPEYAFAVGSTIAIASLNFFSQVQDSAHTSNKDVVDPLVS